MVAVDQFERQVLGEADPAQSGEFVHGLQRVDVALPFVPVDGL